MNTVQKIAPLELVAAKQRTTMDLVQEAVMGGAGLDIIERLVVLHNDQEARQARRAFDAAVSDAKKEIPVIKKNKHVGFKSKDPGKGSTDYDHEDLAEIARTIDPILGRHGLSYRFRAKQGEKITITCILSHRDGHFEENELSAGADASGNKNSIQAIGSTATFLSRYTLRLALGLAASKDDDGAKADGEPQTISEAQLQELFDLAEDLDVDKAKFCRWAKIECFSDILAKDFEKAKQAILAKRKVPADA